MTMLGSGIIAGGLACSKVVRSNPSAQTVPGVQVKIGIKAAALRVRSNEEGASC